MDIISKLVSKFTSCNSVPVNDSRLTREEFNQLNPYLIWNSSPEGEGVYSYREFDNAKSKFNYSTYFVTKWGNELKYVPTHVETDVDLWSIDVNVLTGKWKKLGELGDGSAL